MREFIVVTGCVPQLGNIGIVLYRLGRDTAKPTSVKVVFQINKHTNKVEISKFEVLEGGRLW